MTRLWNEWLAADRRARADLWCCYAAAADEEERAAAELERTANVGTEVCKVGSRTESRVAQASHSRAAM